MIRGVATLIGLSAVIPMGLLLALLPSTPITTSGALYLGASVLVVIGAITAPWRRQRYRGLSRLGMVLLIGLVGVRLVWPSVGSAVTLTALPAQSGVRWLNRLFDEQDIALLGERVAFRLGTLVSPQEDDQLVVTLYRAYMTMRQEDATPLSPFLSTALAQQQPDLFDTLVVAPTGTATPRTGVIFLHGFGGNFTLQCWLFAHAVQPSGVLTLCPSVGWRGDWWTDQGKTTVQRVIDHLRRRGVERIYLAGLSNGALGVSRLAPQLSPQLNGLILISGADPDAAIAPLPVLIIQGTHDERMPAALGLRYADAAGAQATVHMLEGDHFLLAKRADRVQQIIADWFAQQETGNLQPS
jgi:pimeloyl-ACP methyl ester carboxylesterase